MKAEAFLAVLAKSQLLSAEQLDEARDATLLTDDAEKLSEILIDQGLLTGWQTAQLMAGRTSFFVGNYVLMELLGRGGMGSVFLARHTTMNRSAALKIVSKQVGQDPDSLQQFLTEARAIASLDHPNIVRAYDVNQEGNHFYIVMEYVPGNDLEEVVEIDGPLEFEFIADCIRQAADGLAHAHGRNMVHCDIKPSNLLVTDDDTVKILDMGMARLIGDKNNGNSAQRGQRVLGTVDYMAPEQAVEGPGFDHRADIYSLGCTLYFAMTGQPPFNEGSLTERILKHQTEEPPDVYELRPDAPEELVAICQKMMAKDPNARYQSAAEVSRALAEWHPYEDDVAEEDIEPGTAAAVEDTSLAAELDRQNVAVTPPAPAEPEPTGIFDDERKLVRVMAIVAAAAAGLVAILVLVLSMLFPDSASDANKREDTSQKIVATDTDQTPDQDQSPKADHPPDGKGKRPVTKDSTPRKSSPDEPSTKKSGTKEPRPKSDEPPATTPEPDEPKKRREPRNPPQVVQKPIEKPKPVEPLAKLPDAVNLPMSERSLGGRRVAGKAVSLGTVQLRNPGELKLALIGGRVAVGGGKRFTLQPKPGRDAWLVRFTDDQSDATDVAKVYVERDALMFQWTEMPSTVPADHLRNCMLNVTAGKTTQTLQLSVPEVLKPIALDCYEGVSEGAIPLPYPPDIAALRLQITAVEGFFKNVLFVPGDTINADGRTEIQLNGQKMPRIVAHVDYLVRGRFAEVKVTVLYQLNAQTKLSEFSPREVKKLERQSGGLEKREKTIAANIKSVEKRSGNQNQLALLNQQLNDIKSELAQLESLSRLYKATHRSAKLCFRQFLVADGHEIELAVAGDKKPPESQPRR